MKRFTMLMAATALTTTAAFAQTVTGVMDLDTDNDDFLSFEELSAAYPDLTQLNFEEIDENDDNRISSQEMYATEAQDILARADYDPELRINADMDGDGFASYEEMTVIFEGLTPEDFEEMDNNDDERLSQFEIYDTESQDILARYPVMQSVADIHRLDLNDDRYLSLMEMRVAFPGFNAVDFEDIDQNDDNRVSFTELYAPEAQEIVSRYDS